MKVLIVVDMQNDFITGSLGTKEAQAIVSKVVEKIQNWDGYIYATQDTHTDEYLETQEGQKLPVIHCVAKSEGWKIQKDVMKAIEAKEDAKPVIYKAIFGSHILATNLQREAVIGNIEEVQLVGLCTDICVISNAMTLKSFLPINTKIVVDASCCAGVTPESHKRALEAMKMCQIEVINEEMEE